MADRPILFSAPMVRAILAGTKTQTRRPLRDGTWFDPTHGVIKMAPVALAVTGFAPVACPYGQPGDQLWVRETFAEGIHQMADLNHWAYAADLFGEQQRLGDRWKPSIHMPRAASRITLEVVGVRVERLQDISEADAVAEGIERSGECNWRDYLDHPHNDFTSARRSYRSLWEQINGPGSWGANPWVWVVEFKRAGI